MLGRGDRDHPASSLDETAAAQFRHAPFGDDGVDVGARCRHRLDVRNDPARAIGRRRRQGLNRHPGVEPNSISAVALVVHDYDEAVHFFTHALRFAVVEEALGRRLEAGPTVVTLEVPCRVG